MIIFDIYRNLNDLLHNGEGYKYLFAHKIWDIGCNLMSISKNDLNMHLHYMKWWLFILLFNYIEPKGNQTGKMCGGTWHIYLNPNNPSLFQYLHWTNTCCKIRKVCKQPQILFWLFIYTTIL